MTRFNSNLKYKNEGQGYGDHAGFGLLEALFSAMILGIVISTSVSITNKYQTINFRSSLRNAVVQTIDEDLTEVKLELENFLYQKKTTSNSACYSTNRNCIQSTAGVGQCKSLALRAINSSQLIKNEEIKLTGQTHKIYKGLKKTASGLRRIVSVIKPEAPKQAGQTVRLMDDSIVRVQYTVQGELADALFGDARKKTIGSVDYSPPAHASCQY